MSSWVGDDIPIDVPSAARMYDYFLGGYHNFAVDRAAAEAATAVHPDMPLFMRTNRAFLRRAVTYLAGECGIDRFLDLGSGIPTVGNVHEVVREENPDARVVYVDTDPIAVSHSRMILRDVPTATIVQGDAAHPEQILAHSDAHSLLEDGKPIAVLFVALLHFVSNDAEALNIVRAFRDAVPSGSYVALSHATFDGMPREMAEQLRDVYARTANPVKPRTREQVAAFFEGMTLVNPGLVFCPLWRPDGPDDLLVDEPERSQVYAGVGRTP